MSIPTTPTPVILPCLGLPSFLKQPASLLKTFLESSPNSPPTEQPPAAVMLYYGWVKSRFEGANEKKKIISFEDSPWRMAS